MSKMLRQLLYLCYKTSVLMQDKNKDELFFMVEDALSAVRPHLKVDGGDVELVEVTEDLRVKIRWIGMCESCSMSAMTLRAGIAEAIRIKVPEISSVEAVNGI